MFDVIQDQHGEDVLVATFGHGGVVMAPCELYEGGRIALTFHDCCNEMVVGKETHAHEVHYEGMRAMFVFDNIEGLDVLIQQCNECRKMLVEKASAKEVA